MFVVQGIVIFLIIFLIIPIATDLVPEKIKPKVACSKLQKNTVQLLNLYMTQIKQIHV